MGNRLAIYLDDHLAGATVGVELGRRLRGSNRDNPEFGRPLSEICAEWSRSTGRAAAANLLALARALESNPIPAPPSE